MEPTSRSKKFSKDISTAASLSAPSSKFKTPKTQLEPQKHINTISSTATETDDLKPKTFVRTSVEGEVNDQLQDRDQYTLNPDSPKPQIPRKFAEATMSTRTRGRRSTKNEYDPPSAGPKALGQLGIFKFTAKKKKSGKWTPFDYSESPSAGANASDVEVNESGSPRLSRRSSLLVNPTAAEFELQSQPRETNVTLSSTPYLSDSHNGEEYKGSGFDFGEEKSFQIGTTSADRAGSVSAGYSPEHIFGIDTAAHKDKENATSLYRVDATYLKHTRGSPQGEGRVQSYNQRSQGFKHDNQRTWNPTTVFGTDPDSAPKFAQSSLQESISKGFDSIAGVSPQIRYPSVPSSTKLSKNETHQVMVPLNHPIAPKHILKPGDDAFDSLEWDPELPTATSPDSSPEPVPIKPQPVAYTTVGSLVNPNNVPQFSAPNRIQREGANRRPLMSLLSASRQYENVLQPRAPPPPLSMANSMHYAQQIARSPVNVRAPPTNSARSPRSTSTRNMLTKEEEATLMRQLLAKEPQELSLNLKEATCSPNGSKKYSSSTTIPSRQLFSIKELIEEEAHVRSNSAPGLVQGLQKMQTLQRLAKFANPMQELARNRLAEFSLLRSQTTGKTVGSPTVISTQEILLSSQIGISSNANDTVNCEGELDLGFRFPPPGLSAAPTTQANTFAANSSTILPQTTSAAVRPGYPQPLTAGPPGQRPCNPNSNQPSTNYQELWSTGYVSQPYNPYGNGALSSLCGNQYTSQLATQPEFFQSHAGHVKSKLVDTIDPNLVSRYYCAGYPSDMTGFHQPISEENARLMVEGPSKLLPKEVRDARRDEATGNWYYNGQRRYNFMTADDYMKELEMIKDYIDEKQKNSYGVIGPPKKKVFPPVEPKPFTEEEIQKKPITQLVPPALESGWGTLAGYSANNVLGSNSDLSRLADSPDWQIDLESEGNKSYFGEDWGKPRKRPMDVSWGE